MKFYYGKPGGLLPEKNQNFFLLKEAALNGRLLRKLKHIFSQMNSPLLYFDRDLWSCRGQDKARFIQRAKSEIHEEDPLNNFFSLSDFFRLKKAHCYFSWTQSWRA